MRILEDEVRAALRDRAQAVRVPERPALDRDVVEIRRRPGSRSLTAAACLVLIIAGIVALALWGVGDPEPGRPVDSVVPVTTAPVRVTNGWVAFESGAVGDGDISIVRPGEKSRRLEVAGSDTADDTCPAWSPDGTRLLFGRLTSSSDTTLSDAAIVIVRVGLDGVAGAPTVIALDGFDVLDGFDAHPCGIWAPDGRWVAFAGAGEVWLVDTQTGAIRRLPDLRPSDLEWRPGTDQLAIAGDLGPNRSAEYLSTPISIYSVSAGELHHLGSARAAEVTWSPDGSTLAYKGGENDASELWLVDADGTNERLLVADTGKANHGIGPVWSPAGDRIAYQRLFAAERHKVVLVSVTDGTQTVIEPPETDGPDGPVRWYPFVVTWSPDGTTLLYTAWGEEAPRRTSTSRVIFVDADTPNDVTLVPDEQGTTEEYSHRWVPTQWWGRQPG